MALIRSHKDTSTADTGWIAVTVDDSPDNHAVSQHGFEEAVFRNAPLIALGVWRWDIDENLDECVDRRLQTRLARYPDVRVRPVTAADGVGEFVAGSEQPIQLAVVGGVDAGKICGSLARLVPRSSITPSAGSLSSASSPDCVRSDGQTATAVAGSGGQPASPMTASARTGMFTELDVPAERQTGSFVRVDNTDFMNDGCCGLSMSRRGRSASLAAQHGAQGWQAAAASAP